MQRARLYNLIGTVAAILLGVVLLVSSFAKALDAAAFADVISGLGFVPKLLVVPAAYIGICFEAGLGVALLCAWRRPWVLTITTLTFVLFLAIVIRELLHPSGAGCGCAGNLLPRTPRQAVIEDSIFVTLALLAWLGLPSRIASRWRAVAVTLAVLVTLGFTLAAPRLPLDNLATLLRPGTPIAAAKLDEAIPQLQDGMHLLLLIDRSDQATREAVANINKRVTLRDGAKTKVWGLVDDNDELASEFLFTAGPAFEMISKPKAFVRTLYRSLPRSAVIKDGKIMAVWNRLPSDAELDALAAGELK